MGLISTKSRPNPTSWERAVSKKTEFINFLKCLVSKIVGFLWVLEVLGCLESSGRLVGFISNKSGIWLRAWFRAMFTFVVKISL